MSQFIIISIVLLGLIALSMVIRILNSLKETTPEEESIISDKENDIQGKLMLAFGIIFMIIVVWTMYSWGQLTLKEPASREGEIIDSLMNTTWLFLLVVFFLTQPILFYFAYKYRGNKNRKAIFYPHNNRLEIVWTVIPAIALTVLITQGLSTWNDIMYVEGDEFEDAIIVEVYGQQFNWTARYAGEDRQLGYANVRYVKGKNIVGIDPNDTRGKDDIMVKELHLPKNKRVIFKFRSQDIIHSAYMPHFRAQMNCVPGMITQFSFVPKLTTEEYRELSSTQKKVERINEIREYKRLTGKDAEPWEFDYLLLCNKICGASHYNMQMKIIVEEENEFNAWLKSQTKFKDI